MDWVRIIVYASIIPAFLIISAFWGFWQAVHPPKITTSQTPADFGWNYEQITLKTADGLKLAGWFVPAAAGEVDKTIILLHGYPMDKGNLLYWSSFLHDDHNLLFFDFRYFGQSEGKLTTIGFYERNDVLAAINYLQTKGTKSIGLMGFSMGAAVALLTLEKTEDVKAVVSDSAYADIDLISRVYYGDFSILKYALMPLTKMAARLVLGINPDEISPEDKIKNIKLPILLIHSKEDKLVTIENAQRLKEALAFNDKAEFWFIPSGIHGYLAAETQKEYETRILNFFKKNL